MICKHCNKNFVDKKHPDKIFCSKQCASISRRTIPIKICPTCKNEFRKPTIYCSRHCTPNKIFASRKGKTLSKYKTHCIVCNKEFFTIPSANQKTCSKSCWAIARTRKKTKVCKICNKSFKTINQIFCSRKCYFKFTENKPRKPNGVSRNYAIRKGKYFLGNICIECGSKKFICVHHIDNNCRNNNLSNLKILCKSCHQKHHKSYLNFY